MKDIEMNNNFKYSSINVNHQQYITRLSTRIYHQEHIVDSVLVLVLLPDKMIMKGSDSIP